MKLSIIFLLVYLILVVNHAKAQIFTNYTKESTSTALHGKYVCAIASDADGNIWIGTLVDNYAGVGGVVSKFDGSHWTTYTSADGLAGNWVTSIAIDAQGNKWFGTYGDGSVSKFDGTNWTTYSLLHNFDFEQVNAIAIDAQGNKWF
jgi:ligand-binding sensor domain-containing protein